MAQPTIFKVVKNRRVPDDHKPTKGETVKYRFVVDVGTETVTDPTTGQRKERRKQLTRTFRRKREAEDALSKILAEVDGGTFVAPAPTKLNELLDEWLRSLRDIEENTRASYVNGLKPARERLGEKPAQKITVKDVNDLVDWMLTSGRKRGGQPGTSLGPRSVQLTLSRLRAAFAWGIPLRMVSINPAAMVKSPKQSKVKRKPWTAAEMTQFATSLAGKRLEAPAWLALLGIGPAELCGERWAQDVDLDAETITTADNTRTLTWDDEGGHVVEKGGKTDGRVRTLPLIPQITTALRSFKTQQARERLAAGDGYEPPDTCSWTRRDDRSRPTSGAGPCTS